LIAYVDVDAIIDGILTAVASEGGIA